MRRYLKRRGEGERPGELNADFTLTYTLSSRILCSGSATLVDHVDIATAVRLTFVL